MDKTDRLHLAGKVELHAAEGEGGRWCQRRIIFFISSAHVLLPLPIFQVQTQVREYHNTIENIQSDDPVRFIEYFMKNTGYVSDEYEYQEQQAFPFDIFCPPGF